MKLSKIFIIIYNFFFINASMIYSNIQVSLKPLYIIVSSLVDGITVVDEPLIDASQGHHSVQLSHKQVYNLVNSELFIWVGEKLEGNFPQLSYLNYKNKILQLEKCISVIDWNKSSKCNDFHIWLNPELMVDISKEIAAKLLYLYPDQKNKINLNLDNFLNAYNKFKLKWENKLLFCNTKEYMVSHNAINHIAGFIGLKKQIECCYLKTNNHSMKNINKLNQLLESYKDDIVLFNLDGDEIGIIEKIFKVNKFSVVRLDAMGELWTNDMIKETINKGNVPYFLWLNDLFSTINDNILI